jgi:hypothetical protein
MVDKSYMSLFQLRAYRAWLERDKAAFVAENPKSTKKNASRNAKTAWYKNELEQVDYWLYERAGEEARNEMELKAKKFLGPPPIKIMEGKPRRFDNWRYKVEDFFTDMFRIR